MEINEPALPGSMRCSLVSGSFISANTSLIKTRQGVTVCTSIMWGKCSCTLLPRPPHFWHESPSWVSRPLPCLLMFLDCVVSLCCGSMSSTDLDEKSRFFFFDSCLSHHTNCPFRARKSWYLTHPTAASSRAMTGNKGDPALFCDILFL